MDGIFGRTTNTISEPIPSHDRIHSPENTAEYKTTSPHHHSHSRSKASSASGDYSSNSTTRFFYLNKTTMFADRIMLKTTVCLLLVALLVLTLSSEAEATYRKPPFNGSIFGKRGNPADFDTVGKALSAMCEIANEACQSWFPSQDNN
ncbi:uncharacterized protein LOC143915605 [Arctopsyche grandis]|uniref:uncharacterized protein LOC143915605 n=1 Tax=Arctopsyche grandis TaxID=121162 RepID=UPI00406D8C0A